MASIVELATELSKRLAEDARVQAYLAANKAVADSPTTRQLLSDYEAHAERMHQLERQNKPLEPEDKRKLADYQQRMASDPLLKTLLKTQVDYMSLMQQVNAAIQSHLATGDSR